MSYAVLSLDLKNAHSMHLDIPHSLQTSYSPCRPPASTGCKVHKGFYNTYTNVQKKLRATVTEYLTTYPGAEFHITGHSLGGILTLFAAVDLMDAVLPSFPNASISSVYTFGEPRGWVNVGGCEDMSLTNSCQRR